jgi:hypothetical protein
MDGPIYHSILCRKAVPACQRLKGFTFQQENDPKHKTIKNMKYLVNKEKDDWPVNTFI